MKVVPSRIYWLDSDDDILASPLLRLEPGTTQPRAGDMIAAVFPAGAELTIFVEKVEWPVLTVDARVTPWATFSFVLRAEAGGLRLECEEHHRELMHEWVKRGIKVGASSVTA